jgi:Protein of unknown function (DUF1688)
MAQNTDPVMYLRSPVAIRERCQQLFDLGVKGELNHFSLNMPRLEGIAAIVRSETLRSYPNLDVPYHSRWRHFNAGDLDRVHVVNEILAPLPPKERCRSKIELAIISVLLDAGAGDVWGFVDNNSGTRHKRSEGLAIASLYSYGDGVFGPEPFIATGERLRGITPADLGAAFQVTKDNPLLALEGRCALLNSLGNLVATRPQDFSGSPGRLGGILEKILSLAQGKSIKASDLLNTFSAIWPGRLSLGGQNLGDVWQHSKVTGPGETKGLVPFHKLSQWLTYSLFEPLEELGMEIVGVDQLTGLAEYRNGGLFLDGGVLLLKDPAAATVEHSPSSEIIVEWRALTVILLDRIAAVLREMLGKSDVELPLAKVLQGGTWSVGRTLATGRRAGGGPPLKIQSDGTVF